MRVKKEEEYENSDQKTVLDILSKLEHKGHNLFLNYHNDIADILGIESRFRIKYATNINKYIAYIEENNKAIQNSEYKAFLKTAMTIHEKRLSISILEKKNYRVKRKN